MVHAAASTPACPIDSVQCLCRIFPEQSLHRDARGMTPLLLACEAKSTRKEGSDDGTSNGNKTPSEEEDETTPSNQTESQSRTGTTTREDSGRVNNNNGNSSSRSDGSVIAILLQWDETAAQIPDSQGWFPLAHAIRSDKAAHEINMLLAAHPDALDHRVTFHDGAHYPMFFLAALHSQDLDVVYSITRMDRHFQEAVRETVEREEDNAR